MKRLKKAIDTISLVTALCMLALGCAEEGKSGTQGIDCGDHGSAHGDHCHCDAGYFFDGGTCVAPEAITEVCEAHEDETDTEGEEDTEADHHHEACVCPAEGECPCDGEISTYGGKEYCAPELHEE